MNTRNIGIINKATVSLNQDFQAMVQASQKQVSRDFAPVWNEDCNLVMIDDGTDSYSQIYLWDNAQQAGALGEHHVSPKGFPIGNIYVKVSIQAGDPVSTVLSHELLELLLNPTIDKVARDPKTGYGWAVEACDQVEQDSYIIDGIPVSNFVFPASFNPAASASDKFDFLGKLHAPFSMDAGGYANVQLPDGSWHQIFADQKAFERYHSKEHDRSPQILTAKLPFAKAVTFDVSKYKVVKAY